MFGNLVLDLDLDLKLTDFKSRDFKSIDFRSYFKSKHFKYWKFLVDLSNPNPCPFLNFQTKDLNLNPPLNLNPNPNLRDPNRLEGNLVPFSLKNAPFKFQNIMNDIFNQFSSFSIIYINDHVLIFSKSIIKHSHQLENFVR